MRIWIQLYKLKKYLIHHLINLKEFPEVEKDKKDCSKVKKNMELVQIYCIFVFFSVIIFQFFSPGSGH